MKPTQRYKSLLFAWVFIFVVHLNGTAQEIRTVFPYNKAVYADTSIQFQWSGKAPSYTIQVSEDSTFQTVWFSQSVTTGSISITIPLSKRNIDLFWRVGSTSFTTNGSKFFILNRSTFSNLLFDVEASGYTTSSITGSVLVDKGPLANHFTQTSPDASPLFVPKTHWGFPSIKSDGINDILFFNEVTSMRSLFVVMREDSSAVQNFSPMLGHSTFFDFHRGENQEFFSIDASKFNQQASFRLNNVVVNPMEVKFPKQFSLISLLSTGDVRANQYGRDRTATDRHFKGELVEMIAVSEAVDEKKRQILEDYLRHKYDPPIQLGPDTVLVNNLCPYYLKSKNKHISIQWSTGQTTDSILVDKPGTYTATATGLFGVKTTDFVKVNFDQLISLPNDTFLCSNASILFDTKLTTTLGYSILWRNSVQTLATTSSWTATSAGIYTLSVSGNSSLCALSKTFTITADNFPLTLVRPDTQICSGTTLRATASGQSIRSYLWNNSITTPGFVVNSSGNFPYRFVNQNGCVNQGSFNTTITGIAPTIQFAVSGGVDTVCSNAVVTFLNNSSLPSGVNAAAYRWNFGNGITNASLWTPLTTTYTTAGNVLVTLSVAGDNGCSNIGQRQITVLNLPSANFTIASPKLCQNDSIQLVSNSLPNSSVPLNSFTWRSGIATLSGITLPSAVPVKFRYSTFGTFTATLAVANRYGCANSFQRSFSVLPSPLVNFTNTTACLGATTSFADSTIFAGGTSALSRVWDFGNGNTETISTPNNTYTSAGTYPVKLTVTNNATCTAQFTKNVRVNPLPAARVQIPLACVQTPLTFLDLSTVAGDSIVQRRWQVGNVFTSTIPNPSFTFPDSGTYSVMLTVSTRSCTNSLSRPENLVVRPKPISNFTLSPTFGAPPLTVTLTSSVTGFSHLWRWNTQFSTLSSGFTATFADTGSVSIWHRVTNTFGCVDSTLKILKVAPPRIDYAVEGLILGTSAGFQQVTVVVSNKGNVALPSFVIEVTSKDGFTLREKVNMEIQPGQVVSVALNALWPINASKNPYTCSTVLLENYTDQVPTNNERCVFTEGSYTIGNPYPNPTSNDNIYLNITSKTAESVSLQWIDIHGKTWGESSFDIPEGQTSTFEIPVYNLFSGTYIVLVRFQNTVFTRKFIKL